MCSPFSWLKRLTVNSTQCHLSQMPQPVCKSISLLLSDTVSVTPSSLFRPLGGAGGTAGFTGSLSTHRVRRLCSRAGVRAAATAQSHGWAHRHRRGLGVRGGAGLSEDPGHAGLPGEMRSTGARGVVCPEAASVQLCPDRRRRGANRTDRAPPRGETGKEGDGARANPRSRGSRGTPVAQACLPGSALVLPHSWARAAPPPFTESCPPRALPIWGPPGGALPRS